MLVWRIPSYTPCVNKLRLICHALVLTSSCKIIGLGPIVAVKERRGVCSVFGELLLELRIIDEFEIAEVDEIPSGQMICDRDKRCFGSH